MGKETQESISKWADATFGPVNALVVAARMNVEVAELISGLAHGIARIPNLDLTDDQQRSLQVECADVLVMLRQVAHKLGGNLEQDVDDKMSINRARQWNQTKSGRHQHVETPPNGWNGGITPEHILGWAWAEACSRLDQDEDPREVEISTMWARMRRDLGLDS